MAQPGETRKRGKAKTTTANRENLLLGYRLMLLIRRFEEKAGQLYGMGLIGGFCHLYIGQEAVVVGMQPAVAITIVELGLALKDIRTALNVDKGMALLRTLLDEKSVIGKRDGQPYDFHEK